MKKLIFLLAVICSTPALSQVKQSGTITPGHAVQWTTNGTIQDAGPATRGTLTSLGITASGQSFCINSDLVTAAGWQQFCFGVTTAGGGTISVQNFGTALAKPFTVTVNGTAYQFPFTTSGILGPVSTTIGHIATWNNTTGTLLADGGIPVGNGTNGQIYIGQTGSNPLWTSMSGDATITSGGVLTIGAGAVTNAKLANETANTVKCNPTGSGATPQDCTSAQVNGLISPSYFNVVITCGADNTGSTDSTAAFNTCIQKAYTFVNNVPSYGLTHSGTCVDVPPGIYLVSSINMTEQSNACLWANPSTVILYGNQQATSSKPIIDMTGCSACTLHGINSFGMNTDGTMPSILPSTGILLADDAVGGHSTKNKIDFVGVQGFFTNPAIYVFGSTDNEFNFTTSENSHCGAGTLFISSVNDYSIISPYATINSGTPTVSDNTFLQQEVHDCGTAETESPLRIHNASSIRFVGGVNDSSAISVDAAHIKFLGSSNAAIDLNGTLYYSEHGQAATNLIFSSGATVDGFSLQGSDINNHNGYSGNLIRNSSGDFTNISLSGNSPTITTLQPTPSSCGTSPSVLTSNSNNNFGSIREGSTATGCTITFNTSLGAWQAAPNCILSSSGPLTTLAITTSTTAITLTHDSATNVVVSYRCDGP